MLSGYLTLADDTDAVDTLHELTLQDHIHNQHRGDEQQARCHTGGTRILQDGTLDIFQLNSQRRIQRIVHTGQIALVPVPDGGENGDRQEHHTGGRQNV